MAKSPDQVREEIERVREQIASSAAALRQEVARNTDWREWVGRKPGLFLAGAFAVGFWVGMRR